MMKVPGLDNYAQTADQLKAFHGWLAETVAKHPGRLRAYAYTNPFGGDALLKQTAETVRQGGFVGLIVNTSVKGEYLDSDRADPFFAMAAELDVPILLHPPAEPVGSGSLTDWRLVEQVGRFCDVTVGLAALAFGGPMEKYPSLNFIGVTGGGAIALLPNRLDLAFRPPHWARKPEAAGGGGPPPGAAIQQYQNKITQPPSSHIKRLYVDTASFSGPGLQANVQVLGADHVLFGTDSPPLATPLQDAVDAVHNLSIPVEDRDKVLRGNALRLFKLDVTEAAS
jgi:aminocarboxymuconate-semialdehyde decarboxylase